MANCPKCGYKLKLIDVKAECPKCGVNLLYYNQQERLAEDADKAEEEYIKLQPKIDRIKFALIGTKLSIVRIILILIPIGMLFLPLANIKVNIPMHDIDTGVSILNLAMDVVAKFEFSVLNIVPLAATICYFISILGIFVAALISIVSLVFDFVSCSPNGKGFKRNVTLSCIGIAAVVISIISFFIFNGILKSQFGAIYSGSIGIGAFLAIVAFLAVILINVIIKKQNVPVKYKDITVYEERIAKRKIEIAEMEARAEAIRKAYAEEQTAKK